MNGQGQLPPISLNELLARFVTVAQWVRSDKTLRQDAFIPPKDLNLSVTRHGQLSEAQIWQIGQTVAYTISEKRSAKLFGRADVTVADVAKALLRTEPAPLLNNPQHAHITGWPLDKPAQKSIAQQLAAMAVFVPT
ncbi:MAG TPA: hypothetical protein VG167_20860 [Verrucomicrobiae bacterium]|nr:hypothetical protein [Verrucomicrobiae bacterium]